MTAGGDGRAGSLAIALAGAATATAATGLGVGLTSADVSILGGAAGVAGVSIGLIDDARSGSMGTISAGFGAGRRLTNINGAGETRGRLPNPTVFAR
jgi:hypothetical protein